MSVASIQPQSAISSAPAFDVIVIGSGIGGLVTATQLFIDIECYCWSKEKGRAVGVQLASPKSLPSQADCFNSTRWDTFLKLLPAKGMPHAEKK